MAREEGRRKYRSLISPDDVMLVFVDIETPVGGQILSWETVGMKALAEGAALFSVPLIFTIERSQLSDPIGSPPLDLIPEPIIIYRSQTNPWEEEGFRAGIRNFGRPRLVVAGPRLESSLSFAVLSALEDGFDVYVVEDVHAGKDVPGFDTLMRRLTQAGAVAVTWRQVLFEWQRESPDNEGLDGILRRTTD